MTSNDDAEYLNIYELERTIVGTSTEDKRRYVHMERVALLSTSKFSPIERIDKTARIRRVK